jgi:hypothetical protein
VSVQISKGSPPVSGVLQFILYFWQPFCVNANNSLYFCDIVYMYLH